MPSGQPERAVEPHALGDLLEQVIDGADADGVEHLLAVLVCCARVAGHA
jgi:hypothetical protein